MSTTTDLDRREANQIGGANVPFENLGVTLEYSARS